VESEPDIERQRRIEHHRNSTKRQTPGGGCGRALAARNNVIIDVNTCSADPSDSAVNIADQIAAKVPG
jgi:PknH-like extracellular domain